MDKIRTKAEARGAQVATRSGLELGSGRRGTAVAARSGVELGSGRRIPTVEPGSGRRGAQVELEYEVELLERAMRCWREWAGFREERERCRRFTYGNQWGDKLGGDGLDMTEEEHMFNQGYMPLSNNLIRRIVRNVLGVFRNRWTMPRVSPRRGMSREEIEALEQRLHENMELNSTEELYARSMEEFLVSGLAVHRKWFGIRRGRCDLWTDMVSPAGWFVECGPTDFRHLDVDLVGERHEMRFSRLMAMFGASDEACQRLRMVYGVRADEDQCEVIEVWLRREQAQMRRIGDRDVRVQDEVWEYYFLGPGGEVLERGVSPYEHGRHPFVFRAYPMIGEIHSFVGDIIDQQKYTNRLISMYDWILRVSAKGVLLFPEGALPQGMDMNDVAEEWTRYNGVIVYRPKPGVPLPQQVSSNSADIGITELLNIQLRMMEDISGVNGALQGKLENGSVSGTLYSQQTRNSMTALEDLMRTFELFIKEAAETDLSLLQQYG